MISILNYEQPLAFLLDPDKFGPTNPFMITVNAISIIGSVINIATTYFFGSYKFAIGKMVIILSGMDLIANISSILLAIKAASSFHCIVMSFIIGFGYLGSLFWTCCFAHSLILTTRGRNIMIIEEWLRKYVISSFVFSFSLAVILAASRYLDQDKSGYCWNVDGDPAVERFQALILLVPCTMSILFCIFCYAYAWKRLRNSKLGIRLELFFYPLILIICYLPFVLGNVINFLIGEKIVYPYNMILNLLLYSQGFFNSIAYGLSGTLNGTCNKLCRKNAKQTEELGPTLEIEDTFENTGFKESLIYPTRTFSF